MFDILVLASMKFRRAMVLAVFALMLAFGALSPQPAHATCECSAPIAILEGTVVGEWVKEFAQWAKNFALLAQIIEIGTFISGTLTGFKKSLEAKFDIQIAVTLLGDFIRAKLSVLQSQALQNTIAESSLAQAEGYASLKAVMPPNQKGATNQNKHHCYSVVVRMGTGLLSFPKMVTEMVEGAINNAWRGPGKNGTGPSAAAALYVAVFGKSGWNWPPMGNPVDNPPDSSWISADPDFYDAYMNAGTLSQTLELPPHKNACSFRNATCMTGEKRYVPVPENDSKEQKMWVAAELFCYTAAGARPTPPAGAGLATPDGIVISAQWDHCNAIRSAFVHQCAAKIAKHTRPKCSGVSSTDPQYMDCKFQEKVCKAAEDAKVNIQAVLNDANADCKKGLTPYQTEYLARMVCLIGERANRAAGAGKDAGGIMEMNDMCDLSMATWKAQLAAEETAFLTAMEGIHELRDCWPSTNISQKVKAPISIM